MASTARRRPFGTSAGAGMNLIDSGTMCRAASPLPGLVLSGEGVANWSINRRMAYTVRACVPKLLPELQSQAKAMISPSNLAMTVGVLSMWAAAHTIGIGEIVDGILAVIGFASMGWAAIDAAKQLWSFLNGVAKASTRGQLDVAASHLAVFINMVGLTVFMSLLARGASKIRGGTPAVGPVEVETGIAKESALAGESSIEKSMTTSAADAKAVLEGNSSEAISKKRAMIDEFLRDRPSDDYFGTSARTSKVEAFNFAKPVFKRTLPRGSVFVQYEVVGGAPGNWASYVGVDAESLGINTQGRVLKRYVLTHSMDVIEGVAAKIGKVHAGVGGEGGGLQLLLPPNWFRYVR